MISTNGRAFVDTNVLVYAVDTASPKKRERARHVLADADPRDLAVSSQVLAEFYVVVTRKLARPMGEREAGAAVGELAKLFVVPVDAALVRSATELSREARMSLWDAMIVEAAVLAGCPRLLSEDLADGTSIRGVAVENPFR